MNISSSTYSISEIKDMLERRDLIVNEEYQRAPRLWPSGPRTYFIDTILSEYPFPKLYFYEYLDRNTRKTKREIVDGQQRVLTIVDFIGDKFRLGFASPRFANLRFSDLPQDLQERFLGYAVAVDVIRNAEKAEILQMFRRMNAYTLPLNEAEKRHSTFFGEFKAFINRLTDKYAALFSEWDVLTKRQIVRMADAELLTEMVLALERGTISSSNKALTDLYKTYDAHFPHAVEYGQRIEDSLDFVIGSLSPLRGSYMMKPFVVHSLFSALAHNKYGLAGFEAKSGLAPINTFTPNVEAAIDALKSLASAHESKDQGVLKPYVDACSAGSNREQQRTVRVTYICNALRGNL
jgi:uncharacterized protein DUF262